MESLDPEHVEDMASFTNIKQETISQKKSNFKCKITSISSPSSFWIVGKTIFFCALQFQNNECFYLFQEMTPNADQYHQDIQAAIDVYVQNSNAYKVTHEKHIIIGDVYVAPTAQKTYQRARLEDFCPKRKTATMFFIDIGSVAYEVEAKNLIRISREGKW